MSKKRVLFVCVNNSARSQMAEALLKHLAGDSFEVESACAIIAQISQKT